jgi:ABC-type glycerol-3-phosphate transport system substrate-binding protein
MKAQRFVPILPFFLLLLAAWASAQSIDALYQAAKQEGVLNLYGGGPARIYTVYTEQFEKEYPGVKVNVVGGFSNTLTDRITAAVISIEPRRRRKAPR